MLIMITILLCVTQLLDSFANVTESPLKAFRKREVPKNILSDAPLKGEKEKSKS